MKTFKGTQEKWYVEDNILVKGNLCVSTDSVVISRLTAADFETDEEMEANAKLIAAAPDLLKALQELKEAWRQMDSDFESYDMREINQAQAAIDKAL